MGNVAILLKKQGHQVAGSDAGVYPPMSQVLEEAGIMLFEGFSEKELIEWNPERVVVGNAVSRGNAQVEFVLRTRSIPFVSLPQLIGEDLIKDRPSLVVSGTHGKTTTTSLASFALRQLGEDPGFLVGGVPLDLPSGNELGSAESPFVIEGDEYDSAFFDKRSKFIHYRPRVLILNNLEFDHGDIFRDLQDISRSFAHLLKIVPENGFILRNGDDPNLLSLPIAPWCKTFSVGMGEENDLRIVQFSEDREGVRFDLYWRDLFVTKVSWQMAGEFNARNLAMSCLGTILAQSASEGNEIDASNPFAGRTIPNYSECKGVKRRQELLIDRGEVIVISDFAHHPTAIEGTLRSMRSRWPEHEIIACFEPRSNTAVTNVFQDRFADSLAVADLVLLGAVHRGDKIPPAERINTEAMVLRIKAAGKEAFAFRENQKLADLLESKAFDQKSVLLVFFSNGSFDGVIDRVSNFMANE